MSINAPTALLRVLHRGSLAILVLAAPVAMHAGQTAETGSPVETEGLGSGPYASMDMLYERTFLRVDVMRLTLRFGPETTEELRAIVEGEEYDDAIAERVLEAVIDSRDVVVETRFLRDLSFEQYMDGVYRNLADALEEGYISEEEHREIASRLAEQYSPLQEPGIHDGGAMWFRIRGDSFRAVYEAPDGSVLMDLTAEGSHRRRATLGGYLAEGSDFREDLIRSLFEKRES